LINVQRHPRREMLTFRATTSPTLRDYAGPSAAWVLGYVIYLLFMRFGTSRNGAATLVAFGFFFVGAFWFRDLMQGSSTLVTLDNDHVFAGRTRLGRANLSRVLGRWVDAVSGTTTGSALTLTEGAKSVTLGCRGAAPESDGSEIPATSKVTLVLAADDFRALARALGCNFAHARPLKNGVLSVNLVLSPGSAVGLLQQALPLLVVAAIVEAVGYVGVFVLHLPEITLIGLGWLLAAGGIVAMIVLGRRPARAHQRLSVQDHKVTWLEGKRETVVAACALDELAVERRRRTVHARFGTSVQLCLLLHFPGRRTLYFGLNEGSVEIDERFLSTRSAPRLLVGRTEWDALTKRLPP
jgi:hypothetical protein